MTSINSSSDTQVAPSRSRENSGYGLSCHDVAHTQVELKDLPALHLVRKVDIDINTSLSLSLYIYMDVCTMWDPSYMGTS